MKWLDRQLDRFNAHMDVKIERTYKAKLMHHLHTEFGLGPLEETVPTDIVELIYDEAWNTFGKNELNRLKTQTEFDDDFRGAMLHVSRRMMNAPVKFVDMVQP
jgi:hypothetical protein